MAREYVDEDGRKELGVAARITQLGWTVMVEQPTAEAYASATELDGAVRQLGSESISEIDSDPNSLRNRR